MSNPTFQLRTEQDRQREMLILRECFSEKEGVLTWNRRPSSHFSAEHVCKAWNTKWAGKEAGTKDSKGYLQAKVNGRLILVHRIVWMLAHGTWPKSIDHIDGNPLNNALCNLREVTHRVNMQNQKRRTDNRSGLMGVHWLSETGKWIARIQNSHIGTFCTLLDACAAKKSAEYSLAFHANHGRGE